MWLSKAKPKPAKKVRKFKITDAYHYDKRSVLYSAHSPLAQVLLEDIVNAETYLALSPAEKAQLRPLLPPVDIPEDGEAVPLCFTTPVGLTQALEEFRELLASASFDHNDPGMRLTVADYYNRLKVECDLGKWRDEKPRTSSSRSRGEGAPPPELEFLKGAAKAQGLDLFG